MTKSDKKISITIDGIEHNAKPGQMLIELTDQTGTYVPRFCYHEKLSIAANCRMCLVEVENSANALPACATPVSDGMIVHTKSKSAKTAQESTMEFLLINHPLDCPICDQGGECELQDLAYTYGKNESRFDIQKQTKSNDDLGPLVSTDMTRCIMCTRCVRFGTEIAGIQELGTIGRGEDSNISTYVAGTVDHELSGNIIDLCPVGALNNKPYRYTDRTWELDQIESISPHDCIGTNIMVHMKEDIIRRVVPKNNPEINETWIADRDRFGFDGIYSEDRIKKPMIKVNNELREIKLPDSIASTVEKIKEYAKNDYSVGVLFSPSVSSEEQYLLMDLCHQLGINQIDHRLKQVNFSKDSNEEYIPHINIRLAEVDNMNTTFIVGSDLRKETPILAHRVKKSADNGALIHVLNPNDSEYFFDIDQNIASDEWVNELGLVLKAAINLTKNHLPNTIADHLDLIGEPTNKHELIAVSLCKEESLIILGMNAYSSDQYQLIRSYTHILSSVCQTNLCEITEGSNSIGASVYTMANNLKPSGISLSNIVHSKHDLLILYGIEPTDTMFQSEILECMDSTENVIVLSPYINTAFNNHADILIPIKTHYESNGSMINVELRNQLFNHIQDLESHELSNIELIMSIYQGLELKAPSVAEIHSKIDQAISNIRDSNKRIEDIPKDSTSQFPKEMPIFNMYNIDNMLRRSSPLQDTKEGKALK